MEATLKSSGPFICIPSVPNFRDIGGWATPSSTQANCSKRVRPCLVYRSADTLRITGQDVERLRELHIKTVFDLRSRQQVGKLGVKDLSAWGIERVWAPVFSEEEYAEEQAQRRYEQYASEDVKDTVEAFVEILVAGAGMMRTVLRHLLSTVTNSNDGGPIPAFLMHCTTGNNRTGVFVAMLLALLGVPAEDIVYEYTLSDQGLAATRHANIERLLNKGAFQAYGTDEARRKCERMVSARGESMQALLQEVDLRWGGAEGYFRTTVMLEDKEICRVRELLLVY